MSTFFWGTYVKFFLGLILLAALCVAGCEQSAEKAGPVYGAPETSQNGSFYRLAVHPLHNPVKLHAAYGPLVDYLEREIPDLNLDLEASRDYGCFEKKIRQGTLEFLLPNPWQTLEAIDAGYEVLAMAGAPEDFKGIFILRKDSLVREPADLKGQAVSYPAPTALAACIMPQYFLHSQGIDVTKDIENKYVGSQESAIMNAYLGNCAAGATWPPPWRAFQKDHPVEAAKLYVKWRTPPLVNNSFMVRKDMPDALKQAVRRALLRLHETSEGRTILAGMETERFYPADDYTYDIVRSFIDRFEQEVRPVEERP